MAGKPAQCGETKKESKRSERKITNYVILQKITATQRQMCKSGNRIIKEQQEQRLLFIKRVLKQGMDVIELMIAPTESSYCIPNA